MVLLPSILPVKNFVCVLYFVPVRFCFYLYAVIFSVTLEKRGVEVHNLEISLVSPRK